MRPKSSALPVAKFITLRNFEPTADDHGFVGEVIFRDTFGNLITNINADQLAGTPHDAWIIEIAGERIQGITDHVWGTPLGDPGRPRRQFRLARDRGGQRRCRPSIDCGRGYDGPTPTKLLSGLSSTRRVVSS